jgi:glycosyltransferase involved in cell wall biosynthesis
MQPSPFRPLPVVTVVTVVRNGRDFIADTIASVLAQTYPHIEYIVVDGSSTDGTVDIIREYEARLARWISEPDEGIADAFNKGVRSASGDYLLFLNSDDRLSQPGAIANMVRSIVAHGFPMLAFGDCVLVSRTGDVPMYRLRRTKSRWSMSWGNTMPHPSLFFHRSYFDKYGLYDKSFRIAMDYELLLRGAASERILHVPEVVSVMRDGGLSTRSRKAVVDETIRAMMKNRYIRSRVGECRMRAYYAGRNLLKRVVKRFDLYAVLLRPARPPRLR